MILYCRSDDGIRVQCRWGGRRQGRSSCRQAAPAFAFTSPPAIGDHHLLSPNSNSLRQSPPFPVHRKCCKHFQYCTGRNLQHVSQFSTLTLWLLSTPPRLRRSVIHSRKQRMQLVPDSMDSTREISLFTMKAYQSPNFFLAGIPIMAAQHWAFPAQTSPSWLATPDQPRATTSTPVMNPKSSALVVTTRLAKAHTLFFLLSVSPRTAERSKNDSTPLSRCTSISMASRCQ